MIKTVRKIDTGVKVRMFGEVKKQEIEAMVDECKNGQCRCNCDPAIMEKIEQIDVAGSDGDVAINLTGQQLDAEAIAKAVNECMG